MVTVPPAIRLAPLDDLSRSHYDLRFKLYYATKRATEFQELFSQVMERRFPNDFIRVKPWGGQGDLKCDGYVRSRRTLFQVYAPERLESKECVNKIIEDFEGAKPHWQPYFDHWAFVHNSLAGLPPDVVLKLSELHLAHDPPSVGAWGHPELATIVRELSLADLEHVFGLGPSSSAWSHMGYHELRDVLRLLEREEALAPPDLRPPPPGKIALNQINAEAEMLLRQGMMKAHHVERLLASWPQPGFGDEVAQRLHDAYETLKRSDLAPGLILSQLQQMVGGNYVGTPTHQNAVLAVLAYFFERCDIFERETA